MRVAVCRILSIVGDCSKPQPYCVAYDLQGKVLVTGLGFLCKEYSVFQCMVFNPGVTKSASLLLGGKTAIYDPLIP